MNISFAGLHGTGKSTIAHQIAAHFGFQFYSTGMAFRELAKEKNMDLKAFSRFAEHNASVDHAIDFKILQLAQSGQNYVYEGQMPTFMLGELRDFAILLTCDERIRISRMAARDGRSYEDQAHETLVREESERQRFIELYNVDVLDPSVIQSTFDLIINTTRLSASTVLSLCITAVEGLLRAQP